HCGRKRPLHLRALRRRFVLRPLATNLASHGWLGRVRTPRVAPRLLLSSGRCSSCRKPDSLLAALIGRTTFFVLTLGSPTELPGLGGEPSCFERGSHVLQGFPVHDRQGRSSPLAGLPGVGRRPHWGNHRGGHGL